MSDATPETTKDTRKVLYHVDLAPTGKTFDEAEKDFSLKALKKDGWGESPKEAGLTVSLDDNGNATASPLKAK
jgi:hypothetical protein